MSVYVGLAIRFGPKMLLRVPLTLKPAFPIEQHVLMVKGGQYQDYAVTMNEGTKEGRTYTVLRLEDKTEKNNGINQLWDNLTKPGNEMKPSLDAILRTLPAEGVAMVGIISKGTFCVGMGIQDVKANKAEA